MKHQRKNLDIVFRAIQPELILDSLVLREAVPQGVNSREIQQEEYLRYAMERMRGHSQDELENCHRLLCQNMEPEMSSGGQPSVFHLLFRYSTGVLKLESGVPICRFAELLDWRDISHLLGQDIFTTAFLAWQDWRAGSRTERFSWPAIIRTDNLRLQEVLKRGVSENHFHLNGSSQSFALSWACLMNHPRKIFQFFEKKSVRKNMRQNLTPTVLNRASDHQMPWTERLLWAAWLRAELFKRFFLGIPVRAEEVRRFTRVRKLSRVEDQVQLLRFQRGRKVRRPDGAMRCLDYVFPKEDQSCNRLLAGERQFLYQGFFCYLRGELTELEADLFYLYLLLKSQFRGEIIQTNGRVGFKNFSLYQDRKDDFWEDIPEYEAEGRRLAVGATRQDNEKLISLEARIAPKKRPSEQHNAILQTDRLVYFAEHGHERCDRAILRERGQAYNDRVRRWGEDETYFYVVHFIKSKDEAPTDWESARWRSRNYEVRTKAREMALSLSIALERSSYLRRRIRGIDAASIEIGCRPETFATEFRYLKNFSTANAHRRGPADMYAFPQLKATYHVGEDFLDIADGLRAIDEAVQFLGLERGDRLGHALAMGIDPESHYRGKEYQISISKQDWLDDLVWLLYRSVELGIRLDLRQQEHFRQEAEGLLTELYQKYMPDQSKRVTLQDYYESWSLRGDHPDCYQNPQWSDEPERCAKPILPCSYRSFMRRESEVLNQRRGRKELRALCYLYHFGATTRRCGEKVIARKVDKEYIKLMHTFQERLQGEIGDLGLMVECNPTSNYLISTFNRYDEHPIFRFNSFGFGGERAEGQLSVSINTDDQGVFDTSLENEYALLACSMSKAHLANGERRYSRDVIYQYLNHIRRMGNEQSFQGNPSSGAIY